MSPIDQALQTLIGWFYLILGAFTSIFGLIERFLRQLLEQMGVPGRLQSAIILVVAVVFVIAVVRLFGGLFRILLLVFLFLLMLHVIAPLFSTLPG